MLIFLYRSVVQLIFRMGFSFDFLGSVGAMTTLIFSSLTSAARMNSSSIVGSPMARQPTDDALPWMKILVPGYLLPSALAWRRSKALG